MRSTSAFKTRILTSLTAAALAVGAGVALAKDVKVKLTGAEETPPVTTDASGVALFHVKDDGTVTGNIKTKGIEGTAAHIHLGAPGEAGPPIITLTKGADGLWKVPPSSKLTDEQLSSFKSGKLYVNVHSAAHQPGEIRGQLKP